MVILRSPEAFSVSPLRRVILVPLALMLAVLGVPYVAAPAQAAPESLEIEKFVDNPTPQPGQTFTYTIQVRCSEDDCLNTQIVDDFPAGLDGFAIQQVTFSPNATSVPRVVTWEPGGTTEPPATIGTDTSLTVDLQQVTDAPAGVGLNAGQSYTVQVSLRVPDDYPPGTSADIVNTASVSADNANTKTDEVTVNIDSPVTIGVAVDKSWTDNNQQFSPGSPSEIGLDVRNTSNVAVDEIVLQEPKAAPDGAATLDPSNPFTITDFTGFGDVDLPEGCEQVQVDAYVFSAGTWNWVNGPPTATPTSLSLPAGVTNDEVGGIRVTCTGEIPAGDSLSVDLGLEQRATDRNDGSDLSIETQSVTNVATGSVTDTNGGDTETATDDGQADYTVAPLIPTVEASKNITPQRITAGQSSSATVAGTNGNNPVTELHISDLDFFTDEVTFGGFDGPLTWPANATSAEVTYHLSGGGTETVTVAQGETPADPSGPITGFEITWTGPIQANETGGAAFTIDTTEEATGGEPETTLVNEVDADVTASNGLTDESSATDDLAIVDPDIDVAIDKVVRPSSAVEPGETVIASLGTTPTATGDGAYVDTLVIADQWAGDCAGFWNAFDLTAIAPTQVPGGTELVVEVYDGSTWHEIAVYGPESGATVFELTESETSAALAAAGLSADDVQGIRFVLTDADGFPSAATITPNIVYTARGELRDTSCPEPPVETETTYTNTATADAEGETAGGKDLTAEDEDTATGVVIYPEDPTGPGTGGHVEIEKDWNKVSVDAQSGQKAVTHLDWSVGRDLNPVKINDIAGGPRDVDIATTVYDAFNLVALGPVAASDEPYTSGWYFKYDTVTKVRLFDGDANRWRTVEAPGGSWMTADRGFKGYTLTADEKKSTISIRIVLRETDEDRAARRAARQDGPAFDPFAPDPGAGVGYGSTDRRFDLTWQLRTKKRSDGSFVIEDELYNTADEGLVDNTVSIKGHRPRGNVSDRDDDTIQILDPDPLVEVTKSVDPTEDVYTPPVGSPIEDYAIVEWTISGHNASTAKASYVRLTDPATCTDTSLGDCASEATAAGARANPWDTSADYLTDPAVPNPFERFNARSITIGASNLNQVDLDASRVWLLRYTRGTYTTQQTTATAVNAMSPSQLVNVVGISVTYQDTDPATTGGTITQDNLLTIDITSRLRRTLRSSGENLVLAAGETYDQTNRVFAQSYDPITSPGELAGDVDDATTQLTGGIANIEALKSISPSLITEPEHDADDDQVTVTLGANQGSEPRSTLSPAQVVIEDQAGAAEFFDAFTFTDEVEVTQMPSGADQVQIDLYDGSDWVLGTPTPEDAVVLPDVAFADVTGIRVTFSREDGELFSQTVPAPNWAGEITFTADLRDTYRSTGEDMEFPSSISDTQTSQSLRPDGKDSPIDDATDTVDLDPGTHELSVHKLTNDGNRLATAGESVPFDLTIQNSGTGYLNLTEVRDVLPPELIYTGDPAPEFTADPDGTLSEDVTVTAAGSEVVFTWPEGGDLMQPGEVFTIRIYLELQPGLTTGETATNTVVAQTEETLDRCSNTEDGGTTTDDWANDPTTCGTTDYIGTVTGPNLFTIKGVNGSLDGAFNPDNPDGVCNATLSVGDESYYRAPCAADSQVGGTDDWVLHNVNSGTENIDEMIVFDQLPVDGDQLLVSGSSRDSVYRPQLVADSLGVDAPDGTTTTIEVTTSDSVCAGTWTDLVDQAVCEQSGEDWSVAGAGTDWDEVSGLRITLDFTTSTAGSLLPGEAADITFSTVNIIDDAEAATDGSGSSKVVPAADEFAWNQYGVKFRYAGTSDYRKIAPGVVGVHLQTGSVQVEKEITGPAARYAPDEFLIDVVCEVDSGTGGVPDLVELDLGGDAVVELNGGNRLIHRIDGIPLSAQGTTCTFDERGEVGAFGETSRTGTPSTVDVVEATDPTVPVEEQDVPTAQVVTITNDYQYTGLSVTKRLQTDAVDTDFGPFTFTLSCVTATGEDVVLAPIGRTQVTFELMADETWTAPEDRIPVGAECTVTETDTDEADNLVWTGDNVVDNGDGSATVTPGTDPAAVEVTNAFNVGVVVIAKEVDGDGADRYGTGTFVFDVVCTYQDQTLYDAEVELAAGETLTLGPYAAGTTCVAQETSTGGATSTVLDPADGVVTVDQPGPRSLVTTVTMTATNTFDLTSLQVEKQREGDLTVAGAPGPFTVEADCTWLVDGERIAFDVPGGAERVLRARNDYRASYANLPSSSRCTLTETDDGGAAETSYLAEVAGDTIEQRGSSITLDLSTTSGPGEAVLVITNRFESGGIGPDGGNDGDQSGLPGVGARFGPGLVGLALLLIVAGGAAIVAARRRRA